MINNTLFYEKVLNEIPAVVYINTFTEPGNPKSLINSWSNRYALNFIGYSQQEINEMGFSFFTNVLHPDDLELIVNNKAIDVNNETSSQARFTTLQRLKPKGKNDYIWFYGHGIQIETFDNTYSKTFLNVVVEISRQIHSENQLISILNEINRFKNECLCQILTIREKELLSHIARGLTDKEIANKFNISLGTAKTHRNNIIRKLGVRNSASLAAFAATCGYN